MEQMRLRGAAGRGAAATPLDAPFDVGYPRRATAEEWKVLEQAFPDLAPLAVWVTGPSSAAYNGFAFALGHLDRWVNPPQPRAAFEALAAAAPGRGALDGWATPEGEMTHASVRYKVEPLWESKLGAYLRITHGRDGLEGPLYGTNLVSLTRPPAQRAAAPEPRLTPVEAVRLRRLVAEVPDATRAAFAEAYAAWRAGWFEGPAGLSDDTRTRARLPSFRRLAAMGSEVLPLVVERLLDPGQFVALVLFERVVRAPPPSDAHLLEGEQARALRAARRWLAKA